MGDIAVIREVIIFHECVEKSEAREEREYITQKNLLRSQRRKI